MSTPAVSAPDRRAAAPDTDVHPDPIGLEILRKRLQAIADEAVITVRRTAISPVVVESNDCSATILNAGGDLIVGGGVVAFHFGAAMHAVRKTIERHGATIEPGDIFVSNDPHDGGGLHPQDLMVQRPLFVGDRLIAWICVSAHMIDVGGAVPGSFSPAATECYQEALRMPPVRLFRRGVETEIWDIIRTNVRMATIVEMDLRALIAGSHVAREKLIELAAAVGVERFAHDIRTIRTLSEREMRRRISTLAGGLYRVTAWTQWDTDVYRIPCALTVDGDRLVFDFEGSSPQAPHFFNSKPFIIQSSVVYHLAWTLARDIPLTGGVFAPIEFCCPRGSVTNAMPPAPVAAAHMHVALAATAAAEQCVRHAMAASPDYEGVRHLAATNSSGTLGMSAWSGQADSEPVAWIFLEGNFLGAPATIDCDGVDQSQRAAAPGMGVLAVDVEVLESLFPILIHHRGIRAGINGAGRYRSGAGCAMAFGPHGTALLTGQMLGMRQHLPLEGMAGGQPGSTTLFSIRRREGGTDTVAVTAANVPLREGETFEFLCGSSGGVGDPLLRDPSAVAADVAVGRLSRPQARAAYGVVLDGAGIVDAAATGRERAAALRDRLCQARTPARPVREADLPAGWEQYPPLPFYPGLLQRGPVIVTAVSGTALAVSPHDWPDGCALLVERLEGDGPVVEVRSYLDPQTGYALYVEVAPAGEPRSFVIQPARWFELGDAAR